MEEPLLHSTSLDAEFPVASDGQCPHITKETRAGVGEDGEVER